MSTTYMMVKNFPKKVRVCGMETSHIQRHQTVTIKNGALSCLIISVVVTTPHPLNHRSFLKDYKDIDGIHDVSGGYGTFAVAIRQDVYESNDEIKEIIDGLENYCLINEEDYSELETEESDKAWENWARQDLVSLHGAAEWRAGSFQSGPGSSPPD